MLLVFVVFASVAFIHIDDHGEFCFLRPLAIPMSGLVP